MGPGYPNRDDQYRMAADENAMRMRLTPGTAPVSQNMIVQPPDSVTSVAGLVPPPWRIEIPGAQGAPPLLVLREENGLLVVEGDESRWTEGAKKFLFGMMNWAGGAGIRWKDDVRAAGGAS